MKKIIAWIPTRLLFAIGMLLSINMTFVLVTLYPTRGILAWFDNAATSYVVHISVDGLGVSYLQNMLNDTSNPLPNLKKLRDEGAWTMNARTDYDYTLTLPNHTSMLTGRPVDDKNGVANSGHHWTTNITPPAGTTLQGNAGYSIASVFDVAHSNGLRTGLYASKEKFVLFKDSYAANIDAYANYDLDSTSMMNDLLANMNANPSRYTFVHFNDTDSAGHAFGWGSAEYIAAVKKVDEHLGQIFNLIQTQPQMKGKTKIILSTDHGGINLGHSDQSLAVNYTIPMFVWGEGIAANSNLYTLNGSATQDPGNGRPNLANNVPQPIRNGDGGNCALRMLGLPTIPGSLMANLYVPCGGNTSPTATPIPATSTPLPQNPTATPVRQTATTIPATATPITPQPSPSATPTIDPSATTNPVAPGERKVMAFIPFLNQYIDNFEPNNAVAQAYSIRINETIKASVKAQGDPRDYYQIRLRPDRQYKITLNVLDDGDLNLHVYDDDKLREEDVVKKSINEGNVSEMVTFKPRKDTIHYILVSTFASEGPQNYELLVIEQ